MPKYATPEARPCPLAATDHELTSLILTARGVREGSHPAGGNLIADALDALVAVMWERDLDDAYSAAENLVDAASRLRDQADARLVDAAK